MLTRKKKRNMYSFNEVDLEKIEEIREKLPLLKQEFEDLRVDSTDLALARLDLQVYEKILDEVQSLDSHVVIIQKENPSFYHENNIDILHSEIKKFIKEIKNTQKKTKNIEEILELSDKLSLYKKEFEKYCKNDYKDCPIRVLAVKIDDLEDEFYVLRITQKEANSSIDIDNIYQKLESEIKSFKNEIKDVKEMRKEKMEEEQEEIRTPGPNSNLNGGARSKKIRKTRSKNRNGRTRRYKRWS
jgi:hypothetical protein